MLIFNPKIIHIKLQVMSMNLNKYKIKVENSKRVNGKWPIFIADIESEWGLIY